MHGRQSDVGALELRLSAVSDVPTDEEEMVCVGPARSLAPDRLASLGHIAVLREQVARARDCRQYIHTHTLPVVGVTKLGEVMVQDLLLCVAQPMSHVRGHVDNAQHRRWARLHGADHELR